MSNRVDGRKTGLSTQGYPLRKIVERVNGIHILSCGHRLPKPAEATDYDLRKSRRCVACGPARADLAAPDAAWSDEFPVDQQGYYWIQLVSSPDNNVIGFISRNLIHYTNGEKERGELCGKKYKFLGPLQPTAAPDERRQGWRETTRLHQRMNEHEHVGLADGIFGGVTPVVSGIRISVHDILTYLYNGNSIQYIAETYGLTPEAIKDAIAFAQDVYDDAATAIRAEGEKGEENAGSN